MITIPLPFEKHDATQTAGQLVPHLVMRSVGEVLEKNGIDMRALLEVAPANSQLFNLGLWRTLVQDPRISATLIKHLLDREEGQRLATGIKDAIEAAIKNHDEEELAQKFKGTYALLNHDGLGEQMNETTTTILERLANLQVRSVVIEIADDQDRAGLLRRILAPFEDQGLSLTAIDSHKSGRLKFELGIDEQTWSRQSLAEVAKDLEAIGCTVTHMTADNSHQ